jgi:hypothetical protein
MPVLRSFAALTCALVVVLTSVGCGGGESADKPSRKEPIAFADIDQDAWTADLVAAGGVRDNPDLETLYDLTKDDCAKSIDDLALGLTLSGARPDINRINMKYVCPSQADKIDKALTSIQETSDKFDRACETPEQLRTQEQQDMVDAVGCEP